MLNKEEVELYIEPHQMYAEGAHDDKPIEAIIELTLLDMGYIATDIDIFYDDLQVLWRWTADIEVSLCSFL